MTVRNSQAKEAQDRQLVRRVNAVQASKRWDAAKTAYQSGDVKAASRLINLTLVTSYASDDIREEAHGYLEEYRSDAELKLAELIDEITQSVPEEERSEYVDRIKQAMKKLSSLNGKYQHVSPINKTIRSKLNHFLNNNEEVGEVLYQPHALRLVNVARACEREDQACCAYLLYVEAAELKPSAAARIARKKVQAMDQDQELMAEVRNCRKIRNCQEKFDKAVHHATKKSKQSRKLALRLLKDIITEAPQDSTVKKAAATELAKLTK